MENREKNKQFFFPKKFFKFFSSLDIKCCIQQQLLTAHQLSYLDHLNGVSFHLKCHCSRRPFVNHRMIVFLSWDCVALNLIYHWCLALQLLYQQHLPLQRQQVPMAKCSLSLNYHFDFDFQNYLNRLQPNTINCLDDMPAKELAHDLVYRVDFYTSDPIEMATPNMYGRIMNFLCALYMYCIGTCQTCMKTHAVPI